MCQLFNFLWDFADKTLMCLRLHSHNLMLALKISAEFLELFS